MAPQVGVIMGSDSDWPVMEAAGQALDEFGVEYEVGVYSAHRTPQRMLDYAKSAADLQLQAKLTQFQEDLEQLVLDKDAKLREKAGK